MNKLSFALYLAVSSVIALHASKTPAAVHKTSAKGAHRTHGHGKAPVAQRKKIYLPADLWTRVRSGLGLPRPAPVELPPPPEPPMLEPFPGTVAAGVPEAGAPLLPETAAPAAPDKGGSDAPRNRLLGDGPSTAEAAFERLAANSMAQNDDAGHRPFTIEEIIEERRREYQQRLEEYQRQVADYQNLQRQQEIHQRFQAQLDWYAERTGFIRQSVERARPYLHLIVEELEKRKLPLDLTLLPILESGYKPRAESPKEASGIWQFIPSTGQIYGLQQNDWYDGRLDIAASTRAATSFLAHLHRRFKGDWLLALAGYNCGEGRVEQAIAANRAAELPTDFWALALPEETKAYVPRMLALSEMFSKPEVFKLKLQPVPNWPYLAKVRFEQNMALEEVSRLASLSVDQFLYLNPGFIQENIGGEGPYNLLLPAQTAAEFERRLDTSLHPPDPTRQVFEFASDIDPRADAGLFLDAPKSDVKLAAIAAPVDGIAAPPLPTDRASDIDPRARGSLAGPTAPLPAGSKTGGSAPKAIALPTETGGPAARNLKADVYHVHDVLGGETVERISGYYKVDPQLIRSSNKLKPRKGLQPGDRLIIPLDQAAPFDLVPAESEKIFKTAAPGAGGVSEPVADANHKNGRPASCGTPC